MASADTRRTNLFTQMMVLVVLLFVTAAKASQHPEFAAVTRVCVSPTSGRGHAVELEVRGRQLYRGMPLRTTAERATRNSQCTPGMMSTAYNTTEVSARTDEASYMLQLPAGVHGRLYFCLPRQVLPRDSMPRGLLFDNHVYTWHHQGDVYVTIPGNNSDPKFLGRSRREDELPFRVIGLRVDVARKEPDFSDEGVPSLLVGTTYTLRLFGYGFTENTLFALTQAPGDHGDACQFTLPPTYGIVKGSLHPDSVQVTLRLPQSEKYEPFFICVHAGNSTPPFVHQGNSSSVRLDSHEKLVPNWAAIVIICVCLCFSALFSGLNLGLMSLDRTELKILVATGTTKEKQYALKIQPVRNHGNYLLCSILLGNVLVNSTFTILLDDLTSGLIAVLCSTLAIVLVGEITPQAICSRHGLAIGAKTIMVTKVVMGLTFPLAYPVSKLLDYMLGEEIGSVYTRERLKELIKVSTGENDLDKDEVNIISGALELRKKTVADVMTKIEDAFMLDYDTILNFEAVSEIMKSGYSRIPVFENHRKNIITTLYIKDLAFVDPDDNTPLKTLCQFYQNPCNFVFEDVTLDIMFKDFKEGNKGHMAFVNRVNNEGEGDPFYETIGLITLEDVIEELIQAEIMDETDVFTDNRTKRRRNADRTKQDFTVFAERRGENNRIRISPQLTLATYQYLSTSIDLFKPAVISETIMRRLLKQDIMNHIKKNRDWRNDPTTIIYQQGKPVDYFVLILEGRVEVTVGQEKLMFESGPFTYFGTQALSQNVGVVAESPSALGSLQSLNMDSMLRYTFQPDYGVRACTEVLYMRVRRNLYMAAKRATLMERSQRVDNTTSGDQFDDEVEKLLHSLEEEGSIGRNSPEVQHHRNQLSAVEPSAATAASYISQATSPRTPSIKSHISPSGVFGSRDLNGAVKPSDEFAGKEEERALLSKIS